MKALESVSKGHITYKDYIMATKQKSTKSGTKQESQAKDNFNGDSQNYDNGAMVSLGGLWLNRDKNGQIYFSGYLGNAKMFIFKNKKKTSDNQPDYYMQLANSTKHKSANANDLENEIAGNDDTDEIPF